MLKIYNTLSRKIEEFKPIDGQKVRMFVCGPTVYDLAHLGNAKTYTQFDFIARYLRYRGYEVFYLQNITDIDDKIIKKAAEEKLSWQEISEKFTKEYFEDMKALHNTSVNKYAKATDYIKEIVSQVKVLLDKNFAYQTNDGIYYDVSKFPNYGKLSGRTEADQNAGVSRIDESLDKKNKNDFCLWKFSKPGDPAWKTEIGGGRPGWHIEDTAITEKFFGPQYDLHGGATDLIFPHHEAEIAQMEAASGKSPLVCFWLHTAFLNINSEKMSKSKGNFLTAREVLEKYGYRVLRFFFISNHYRTILDFSEESLDQAKNSLARIDEFISKIDKNFSDDVGELKKKVLENLDNDFDTPKALAAVFNFIRKDKAGRNAYQFFQELNTVFDFFEFKEKEIPEEIKKLLVEREKLRREKKFAEADKIREELKKHGYSAQDKKL